MKITFLGAAQQVTGSRTLVEWRPNRYFLVDCGMEQGVTEYEMEETPVPASKIEYVFLTHAHIDHSGMIPLLTKQGFNGTIYSTPETMNLCYIMLADSANIQEEDAARENRKNLRAGKEEVQPLYTISDVQKTMTFFRPCEYGNTVMIDDGLSVRFFDAGHLLGSSFIEFFLEEEGEQRKLTCSGDVGNTDLPILCNPHPLEETDYLLIESTYGMRNHEVRMEPIPFLVETLKKTFERKGTVIIPSFAVGRTQELLYFFREIKQRNLLPEFPDFPVYVDSPLANEATAVFLQCSPECLDEQTLQIMKEGTNPIWFQDLHTTVSAEESKALNMNTQPKVIISSSGMCEGGRIRHHLKHNLWDEKNTIMFVGYQAVGTLGRLIYEGAKTVRLFGEEIDVKAEICLLNGVSGHADQRGLLNWINTSPQKPKCVFVNHGDPESSKGFARLLNDQYQLNASAPCSGSVFDMTRGEWIRLTDPVICRKPDSQGASAKKQDRKKNTAYEDFRNTLDRFLAYADTLRGVSNSELRKMTETIRKLME